jgi:hypothetical protein
MYNFRILDLPLQQFVSDSFYFENFKTLPSYVSFPSENCVWYKVF